MLILLKQYLQRQKRSSLLELAAHFEVTPQAMQGMLTHWIRNGKVRILSERPCGKSCCQCNVEQLEIYEWTE